MRNQKRASLGGNWVVAGLALSLASVNSSFAAKELAKVNDVSITDKDLNLALSSMPEGQRTSVLKDPSSRKQILWDVIDREILAQEGLKMKLDQDQDFKDQVELYKKQLLMARALEKNFANKISASSAKKYFETHKERYSTDRAHIQQILVFDEPEARKLLELAKDGKSDFQELAEKHSKDPSAKNNRGDLGFIGRDRFVPEFTEAAFTTQNGQITGPIKTSYGYHIIKVIEKRIGKTLEFDEVELQVRNALRQELVRNHIDNLKKQAKIQVDGNNLERF